MQNLQRYILNNQSLWRGRLQKINNQEVVGNNHFIIRRLNSGDVAAMSELSAQIYQHLGAGEECFIHKHDQTYYQNIINTPDYEYIGVFHGKNLIAMSYLHICRNHSDFCDEIPGCPRNFFNTPNDKLAAFGGDSVLPAYRGNSLNQIMISYRMERAASQDCQGVASIIDRHNHWNMPPYFNNGFSMIGTATDPSDNGKIAIMHHNLCREEKQTSHGIAVPFNRLNVIDNLLAKGYIGGAYNPQTASISFVLPSPQRNQNRQPLNFSIITNHIMSSRHV